MEPSAAGPRSSRQSREPMDMRDKIKHTLLETAVQIFWLPLQIIVLSFSGIIVALLYIKTRLAGGESMHDLIERFEDDGRPRREMAGARPSASDPVWPGTEQTVS